MLAGRIKRPETECQFLQHLSKHSCGECIVKINRVEEDGETVFPCARRCRIALVPVLLGVFFIWSDSLPLHVIEVGVCSAAKAVIVCLGSIRWQSIVMQHSIVFF